MPIEQVSLTGYLYQCDRCPERRTRPALNTRVLAALNPGWQLPSDGDGATLCPDCAGRQASRRKPGKTLRELLRVPLGDSLDVFAFWRMAETLPGGDNLTARDLLEMRFHANGNVRQTYSEIAAALGISPNRARAMVLRAAYRVRSQMRK